MIIFFIIIFPFSIFCDTAASSIDIAYLMRTDEIIFLRRSAEAILGVLLVASVVEGIIRMSMNGRFTLHITVAKFIVLFAFLEAAPRLVSYASWAVYNAQVIPISSEADSPLVEKSMEIEAVLDDFHMLISSVISGRAPLGIKTVPITSRTVPSARKPEEMTLILSEIKNFLSPRGIMVTFMYLFAKTVFTIAKISRTLMFEILWPMLYQIVIAGFSFAAVFAGLPGGMNAIKQFFITFLRVSSWPILYSLCIKLTAQRLTSNIVKYIDIVASPWSEPGIDQETAAAMVRGYFTGNYNLFAEVMAYIIFYALICFLIPLFARMVIRPGLFLSSGSSGGKNV
ncbi:MAG: hypothetical protein R6W70_02700 [bacterium]